jgi:hypothetical protein
MIVSQINGGVGNQMFQYAAGKTLACLNNTILKLDVSEFDEHKLRSFDLFSFEANIISATKSDINDLLPSTNFEKASQYFLPLKKRTYYREKAFSFDDKVLRLGKNVFLKGYFQSEKYFLPAKNIIRKDFTLKTDIINHLKEFGFQLRNQTSVSIHVRRGDFSKDPEIAEYHGTLEKDYYNSAIDLVTSKVSAPVCYLFSDDIDWVKQNLVIDGAIYVSNTITKNHIEDLYLMSQCRHNIIANSSFSWWGAWLNDNPRKVVVAPEKWFNKGPKDTQDIIPAEWYKL